MGRNVFENLSGKMSISMPYSSLGEIFNKSVIYIISHSQNGTVGFIVNNVLQHIPFKTFGDISIMDLGIGVHFGGPAGLDKCFLIHSPEYKKNSLFQFNDDLAISSNSEIIQDLLTGAGPRESMFVIGYTGWSPGQLEQEIQNNFWIVSEYDRNLIFSDDDNKWSSAISKIGIDSGYITSINGLA